MNPGDCDLPVRDGAVLWERVVRGSGVTRLQLTRESGSRKGCPVAARQSVSWLVFEGHRTLLGILVFGVAAAVVYATLFPWNPDKPPPRIAGAIAGVIAAASLRMILQGGCRLHAESQFLVRWWGPFFSLRTIRIPFERIQSVVVSGGAVSRIDGGTWFSATVRTEEVSYRVKALRERDAILQFAETLARVTNSEFVDETVPEQTAKAD